MISDVKYYTSVIWRRFPIILAIVLPAMVASFFIAQQLPTVYRTSATLLLEASSIPNELTSLRNESRAQEKLQVIQQRMLTRANVLAVADEHDVFLNADDMSPDDIVDAMREATSARISSGRNSATTMTVAFEGRSASLVQDVVDDYVTQVLREDSSFRQAQARQTEEFFQQEVDRLAADLDAKSALISKFRSENAEALPETFQFRLERVGSLQERSADLTQQVLLLAEQRRQLVDALGEQPGAEANTQLTLEEQKLADLRIELAGAMETGGETSPRVRILRSRISQVEQVIASLGGGTVSRENRTEVLSNEISQIDTQLSFLQSRIDEVNTEAAAIEETLGRTPAISIALNDLERDFLNTQEQYNTVVSRLAVAETTERIQLLSRGERITVLEPATAPSSPFKPSRKKVMAAGTAAGLMLALALVLGIEFLNPQVKRPSTIQRKLGITPIATLPYIQSKREIWTDRAIRLSLLCMIFIGVPAVFWAVHTYYLPLDLLAEQVLDRLGV